jgi:hypothetical protein
MKKTILYSMLLCSLLYSNETEAFIEKEYAKICVENDGFSSKLIPMLLSKVYYELINEERENIVNTESEFKRSLKNSFKERTSTCTTKTRYIDGVTKEKETNVEYLLNLED